MSLSLLQLRILLRKSLDYAAITPEIHWIHAQVQMMLGEPRRALQHWEHLMDVGGHEIEAHRGIALASCACQVKWPVNKSYRRDALEHAQLASLLSGRADWSCQIAMALATAVNGDLATAATIAEEAASYAVADQQTQCLQIADELLSGSIPVWSF